MEGTQEWIDEYGRVGDEGKMALLLGRNVKSLERKVSNRVDECVMEEVRKWWQRRKELVYGGSPHEPGPLQPPNSPPPQKKPSIPMTW